MCFQTSCALHAKLFVLTKLVAKKCDEIIWKMTNVQKNIFFYFLDTILYLVIILYAKCMWIIGAMSYVGKLNISNSAIIIR